MVNKKNSSIINIDKRIARQISSNLLEIRVHLGTTKRDLSKHISGDNGKKIVKECLEYVLSSHVWKNHESQKL